MSVIKRFGNNSYITTVQNDNSIQIMKASTFDFEEPVLISSQDSQLSSSFFSTCHFLSNQEKYLAYNSKNSNSVKIWDL